MCMVLQVDKANLEIRITNVKLKQTVNQVRLLIVLLNFSITGIADRNFHICGEMFLTVLTNVFFFMNCADKWVLF